jgi:predicted DNA-binding transcriptional regulator AlpA
MDEYAVVSYAQLMPEFGIPYCRTHIDRLELAGTFPRSFQLQNCRSSRRVWWRREIVEWLKARATQPTAPK